MAETELGEIGIKSSAEKLGSVFKPQSHGFSLSYLLSYPGLFRTINIVLGAISLGLWLPGYEHRFEGDRINQNGETERGYGNGWKREPVNQFVLAVIIICLATSVVLLVGLIVVKNAVVDWKRMNKMVHLLLAIFLAMGAVSATFGVWYFNENCCHVNMDLDLTGLTFSLEAKDGNYMRHCYCYLTRYLNLGNKFLPATKETILYDPLRNQDISEYNQRWSFAAHHLSQHVATVFIMFLNAVFYGLAFRSTKPKEKRNIPAT